MIVRGRTKHIRNAPIIQLLEDSKVTSDTISLGQGIPFFPPPKQAIDVMIAALATQKTSSYSPDQGLEALREVITTKLFNENKLNVDSDQIMVTAGANQGFINILLTITNPLDEIILISPTYFNYVMAVKLAGCTPRIIPADKHTFLPDIERIKNTLSDKTRAIVTISPNNPTGVVYPKSLLKEINRLCADQNIYHISDEVYEYFTYDQATHVSPAIFDPMIDSTVSLFSCSKSFGMAGYRIGYMVYPDHLKDEILKVQDTIGICAPVPSQYAAIEAIKLGFSYMKPFLPEISQIRTRFFRSLSDIDSIDVNLPQGSLYFFIHFKDKNLHDTAIAKMLIDSYKVVSLPGSIFDADFPSLRISFGNLRLEHSIRGCERLTNGLTEILKQV